jgi:lysophospholipase L1-like esterase
MSPPQRHPLRILVKGSSLVVMTPDTPTAERDYTFPRLVQNRLLDLGHAVEVDNRGVAGDTTRAGLGTWETEVMATAPDVAIYGYAYYECIHAFLPRWLERHVNSRRWRRGVVRTAYRSWLLRPAWKVLAQTQRVFDIWLQDRFYARRARRITTDYELLVRRTRTYVPGRPLVLVLALLGPGGAAGQWFPGMAARISMMNRELEDMVARIADPDVRLVPVRQLAGQLGPDEDPVPDGMHYSPRMRRVLSDWIAAEIDAAWVERNR